MISAWQNIYLWLFFYKYTAKTGGICWEGLEDHHIQTGPCNSIEKNNHFVFICQRANRGECKHAVCHEFHYEHSKAQKRSRGGVLSENELIQSCHHELCNLCYVLKSGGVPEVTWEVLSGQNLPWVVLSVRGCLLWGIHNGGHFMGLCVCVMCRVVMICDGEFTCPY